MNWCGTAKSKPPSSSVAITWIPVRLRRSFPCNLSNRVNPVRTPIAMQKLIECVPNFSEGRDPDIIRQIIDAIASVDGVSLLDVDPGATTNRTVVTFVGSPEAVVEGAFRGIQKAAELIDMRKHEGAHPRMGAT